jgi:hypothetical protein
VLVGVVGCVWDNGVCVSRFSVDRNLYVMGGSVYGDV